MRIVKLLCSTVGGYREAIVNCDHVVAIWPCTRLAGTIDQGESVVSLSTGESVIFEGSVTEASWKIWGTRHDSWDHLRVSGPTVDVGDTDDDARRVESV